MIFLTNSFERRTVLLCLDREDEEKIKKLIIEIEKEFPYLSCPSKDECENFKWFVK